MKKKNPSWAILRENPCINTILSSPPPPPHSSDHSSRLQEHSQRVLQHPVPVHQRLRHVTRRLHPGAGRQVHADPIHLVPVHAQHHGCVVEGAGAAQEIAEDTH